MKNLTQEKNRLVSLSLFFFIIVFYLFQVVFLPIRYYDEVTTIISASSIEMPAESKLELGSFPGTALLYSLFVKPWRSFFLHECLFDNPSPPSFSCEEKLANLYNSLKNDDAYGLKTVLINSKPSPVLLSSLFAGKYQDISVLIVRARVLSMVFTLITLGSIFVLLRQAVNERIATYLTFILALLPSMFSVLLLAQSSALVTTTFLFAFSSLLIPYKTKRIAIWWCIAWGALLSMMAATHPIGIFLTIFLLTLLTALLIFFNPTRGKIGFANGVGVVLLVSLVFLCLLPLILIDPWKTLHSFFMSYNSQVIRLCREDLNCTSQPLEHLFYFVGSFSQAFNLKLILILGQIICALVGVHTFCSSSAFGRRKVFIFTLIFYMLLGFITSHFLILSWDWLRFPWLLVYTTALLLGCFGVLRSLAKVTGVGENVSALLLPNRFAPKQFLLNIEALNQQSRENRE